MGGKTVLTRPQLALILHALALPLAMWFIVPTLTANLGGPAGYLLTLTIYWLGFCLPVIAIHVWRQRGALFSEKLPWRDWWVPGLLLLQVGAIAIAAFVPNTTMLTTHGAMLAAGVALINGPLEELAWRGGFTRVFATRPRLGFWLGWALFTAWHAPLLLSHGIVFAGGWPALLGGAAALGLVWSWIAWRTGSVFWVTIAHVLTNILTFWLFFDGNGFV
jgi:membrane protease YdiL (CAAX protease family)